jgi:hypothetical protein
VGTLMIHDQYSPLSRWESHISVSDIRSNMSYVSTNMYNSKLCVKVSNRTKPRSHRTLNKNESYIGAISRGPTPAHKQTYIFRRQSPHRLSMYLLAYLNDNKLDTHGFISG